MNTQLSLLNTANNTVTPKIKFVYTGYSTKVSRRGYYEPAMRAIVTGYDLRAVEKATTGQGTLTKDVSASRALELCEALKEAGYNVTIAKEAMKNEDIKRIFTAPRPGEQIGTISRSSDYSTYLYVTCATKAECLEAFAKECAYYAPQGYGTNIQKTVELKNGLNMIVIYRSNSCD